MVASIEDLGIDAVELPHASRQIRLGRLNQQVVVVAHLTPGLNDPTESFTTLGQYVQPCQAIRIVQINVLAAMSTRGHMVEATSKFKTQGTGHDASLAGEMSDCMT